MGWRGDPPHQHASAMYPCNTAGIDSVRAWRKAREFFPAPFLFFWISFVKGDFEKTHFSKLRACVRPSGVQKPIALVSANFASPKVRGSKKRQIPFELFSPSNRSICFFAKSDRYQKSATPCQRVFFVKFTTVHIFPAVSPQTGAKKY